MTLTNMLLNKTVTMHIVLVTLTLKIACTKQLQQIVQSLPSWSQYQKLFIERSKSHHLIKSEDVHIIIKSNLGIDKDLSPTTTKQVRESK